MCGIFSYYQPSNLKLAKFDKEAFIKAGKSLQHRGPDGQSFWMQEHEHTIAFLHRRLAINDLSTNGVQPFFNEDKRIAVIINGEIYNYEELKAELETKSHVFMSRCDCEVLAHAYEEWGQDCLQHIDGMFAFLLWDERKQIFFGGRDRFGEKPLYFIRLSNNAFLFASEIKALIRYPGNDIRPNEDLIKSYLAYNILPTCIEDTLYYPVKKILPAHFFSIDREGNFVQKKYWELNLLRQEYKEKEAIEKWKELFKQSLERRKIADVEIGSSLSGGLDSSAIVSLLADSKFNTFSVRSEYPELDEGEYIASVSEKYNVIRHDVWMPEKNMEDIIDKYLYHMEEPYHEATALAAFSLFREVKKTNVKVLLDGQGGDELLCGYTDDFWSALMTYWNFSPETALNQCSQAYEKHNLGKGGDILGSNVYSIDNLLSRIKTPAEYAHLKEQICNLKKKEKNIINIKTPYEEGWSDSKWAVAKGIKRGLEYKEEGNLSPLQTRLLQKLFGHSFLGYLHYVDKLSMAYGVEVRLPFLFVPLVEFTLSLPVDLIFRNGVSKYILREALKQELPEKIYGRLDKKGFTCSQEKWIKNLDQGWLEEKIKPVIHLCSRKPKNYLETWRLISASSVMTLSIKEDRYAHS